MSTAVMKEQITETFSRTQRIARHLWRMCFALFVSAASIFLARQHLFPAFMRKTGALIFLSVLPLLLLIFWPLRVRLANASRRVDAALFERRSANTFA